MIIIIILFFFSHSIFICHKTLAGYIGMICIIIYTIHTIPAWKTEAHIGENICKANRERERERKLILLFPSFCFVKQMDNGNAILLSIYFFFLHFAILHLE